jgi:hypothetical protein
VPIAAKAAGTKNALLRSHSLCGRRVVVSAKRKQPKKNLPEADDPTEGRAAPEKPD